MKQELSFWERRRAGVQAEAEAESRAELEAIAQAKADEMAEKDDAEILAEMGLPDPDAMQQGDDFAAFMSRDVPERLRKKALRTLWRSNPVLACVDGLNDYDDDFTIGATGNGPIKTAYQVGKGMMYHIEEMARQAAEAQSPPVESVEEDVEPDAAVALDAPEVHDEASDPEVEVAASEMSPAPRRMRFRFEEAGV